MTKRARIWPGDTDGVNEAARLLCAGELVAIPTETVYGLAGDATNDDAVARIFEAKARPSFNPLIVHVSDRAAAQRLASWNDDAGRLADAFWPGPLTLVLRRRPDCPVSLLASAGLDTVALRSPAHPVARALLERCEIPLAAPSANPAGRLSPTRAEHVMALLGDRIPAILDGGPCAVGIESTVVDVSGDSPALLRVGSVTEEQIERVLGRPPVSPGDGPARSPGMMLRHYAPTIPIRLNATSVEADEALLAFGSKPLTGAAETLNLSAASNTTEAAANLFAMLHRLDDRRFAGIAVMPIPTTGLGVAINDRLVRAARMDDATERAD